MKILAIGDFHGKFPEKLKRVASEVDLILSTGDYAGIDDFRPGLKKMFKSLQAGVSTNLEEIYGEKKYKKLLKKDYAEGKVPIKILDSFKVPVFSVFGNGDWYKEEFNDTGRDFGLFIKNLKNVKSINRGKGFFEGLRIVGFGGYIDNDVYFTSRGIKAINTDEEKTEERFRRYEKEEKKLIKLVSKGADILLTHYPPLNCLDVMKEKGFLLTGSHMGVSMYNRAIKKYRPSLVVCGHMHENQGKCKIGSTVVVNPGSAGDGKAAVIRFDEKSKKVLSVRFIR